MKKLAKVTLLLLLFATIICSCSSDGGKNDSLIGKWKQTINQGGYTFNVTYDFQSSDKVTQFIKMTGNGLLFDVEGTCDYTYSDDKITFNFSGKDMKINKMEFPGVSDAQVEMIKEQSLGQFVNMEQVFSNVKIEDNKLTCDVDGKTVTLTRE